MVSFNMGWVMSVRDKAVNCFKDAFLKLMGKENKRLRLRRKSLEYKIKL